MERSMQVFDIAPAAARLLWILLSIPVVVLIAVVGVLGAAASGSRSARAEVSPAGLRLRGDLYGRLIPPDQIRGSAAVRVDLVARPELVPVRRTVGTALPGYQAGWFRLRSGEKALVYLTDRHRAVYIPTTQGYSLL